MKTMLEKLEAIASKFNTRAERARGNPRTRENDIAWLDSLSVYRWDEEDENGKPTGFSTICAEFDFYRNGPDHFKTYTDFEAEVAKLGLRIVHSGVQSTEIGGGNCYRIEI